MDTLKDIGEFQTSDEVIEELKRAGFIKLLNEGEVLLQESNPIQFIPIILSGTIKVYRTDDDIKEILLYYLKPGDTCIMSVMGGFHNEISKVKAVANEASEVLLVPVHKIGPLMKKHPEWINYILRIYHQRFEELLDVVNAIAFKKMDDRLLHYLKRHSNLSGELTMHITHEEIANELGTSRVVISRLLKQMEKEKLVELGRNRITLL
ncbi:MAG: Crp/Fnr family transcriptional regulator [Balneolaceae bacterium]|nr:Crp/Fnr family transcriptional regulator [Balneolaceae bacterium]MCH8550004.1 Crp/Fnr family transcriptional regulator [Balneolaceae bacterium]